MSAISSILWNLPGMGTEVEEFQSAFTWGPPWAQYYTPALFSSACVDSNNTPTTTLRMGLVLGQITATGLWTNYSATATDGSDVARGVLPFGMNMENLLTLQTQQKFAPVMVGGLLKGSKLIGLDNMAREQLRARFTFDDNLPGLAWFPFKRFVSKTQAASPYQVLSTDNSTLFDNTGATGAVTFTLPALANGYFFGFRVVADQTITVASSEGTNMVAFNNASASSVAFSTGGAKIGGMFWVYTNPAATKWVVENHSAGANTVTVA